MTTTYTVHNENKTVLFTTRDANEAQYCSQNGCVVTAVTTGDPQ